MKRFFLPSILLMNQLKYSGKFISVSIIFLIPLFIMGFGYLSQAIKSIEKTEREYAALQIFPEITQLYRDYNEFQQEALLARRDLSNEQANREQQALKKATATLDKLKQLEHEFSESDKWLEQLETISKSLKEISEFQFNVRDSVIDMLANMVKPANEIFQLKKLLSNESGIANDPDLANYYLARYLTTDTYTALAATNKTLAITNSGLALQTPDSRLFDEITIEFDALSALQRSINANSSYLVSLHPDLEQLAPNFLQQQAEIEQLLEYIDEQFFLAMDITVNREEVEEIIKASQKSLLESFSLSKKLLERFYLERISLEQQQIYLLLTMVVISLLIAGYLFIGMSLSIGSSVRSLVKTSELFSEGDIDVRAKVRSNDEMASLVQAFNWMIDKVGTLLDSITQSSESVTKQANLVENIASQTGEAIAKQQVSTREIVGATQELLVSVEEISRNAEGVSEAVNLSTEQAESSAKIVRDARQSNAELSREIDISMEVIEQFNTQSKNISQVLDVIKAIAEQTNLLALNAAIEAARAGEQGRGFAVVADEVRSLAQRTQKSTQEIETTIEGLQSGVSKVVQVMHRSSDKTQKTLTESGRLDEALDKINQMVEDIQQKNLATLETSKTQQSLANNIERLLQDIQQVSESTANYSKDTIDAGHQMTELSVEMTQIVETFHHRD